LRKIGQEILPTVLYGAKKMNMISTGAFLNEMNASDKQKNSLVSKLVSAWEQKNTKTARAGGVSLMALSLAACGSSDDDAAVSYTQVQLDAAKLEATTAAEAVASTAATAAAETAATTQAAAVVTATAAGSATATAAAAATAVTVKAAADVALSTLQASYDALVVSNNALQATYDSVAAGSAPVYKAATVDTLVGTQFNDTFTGTASTHADTDQLVDSSTTDADVLNLDENAAITPDVTNVETINLTMNSTGATTITASSIAGAKVLNVTKGDVTVGDSVIAGNKAVDINAMDAADVLAVNLLGTVTTVNLDQTTTAGTTLDAGAASGNVTIIGAGTFTANSLGTGDTFSVEAFDTSDAASAAGATTANAVAMNVTTTAATVNLITSAGGDTNEFTGNQTVTANSATTVLVDNATGGLTLSATADNAQIRVDHIDSTGASITVGTGINNTAGTSNSDIDLDLDGTTATTDVATIAGAGAIDLDVDGTGTDLIETLNLSGTTAAVTYQMVSSLPTSIDIRGSQDVTFEQTADGGDGLSLTDSSSGTTIYNVTGTGTGTSAFDKIGVDHFNLTSDAGFDSSSEATMATGASVRIAKDQTGLDFVGKTAKATLNLATADDTAADGTTILIEVDDMVASSNITTVNLDATIGAFDADSVVLATTGILNISGTKNVDLGNVTAKSVISTTSGIVVVNSASTALTTVTTLGGADTITMDLAAVVTVSTGAGIDTVTAANNLLATSSFDLGAGGDTITVSDASALVIVAGSGNDTMNIAAALDTDSIYAGGVGTDTLAFGHTGAIDIADNTNFAMTDIEAVTIASGGLVTLSAAQYNGDSTFSLTGAAVTDKLIIEGAATADTIDGSTITSMTTVSFEVNSLGGDDIVTGTSAGDIINGGIGADSISGGAGTDTVQVGAYDSTNMGIGAADTSETGTQSGVVVNLSSAAVTSTSIVGTTAAYTADSVTSVASNTSTYLYASDPAASAVGTTDTLNSMENITGSAGADYLIGSAGVNTIIGGTGADFITGGLGIDLIVVSSGLTKDTVTDFAVGATGDSLHLDLSALNAASGITSSETDTLVRFTSTAVPTDAVAGVSVIATIDDDTSTAATVNGADVIILNGGGTSFANVGTAVDAFEIGGSFSIKHKSNIADDDTFIFAYENSTTGVVHIAAASFQNADNETAGSDLIAAGDLKGTDLVQLTGITDVTTLTLDNFDFIA
jgi:hypothetical protein